MADRFPPATASIAAHVYAITPGTAFYAEDDHGGHAEPANVEDSIMRMRKLIVLESCCHAFYPRRCSVCKPAAKPVTESKFNG